MLAIIKKSWEDFFSLKMLILNIFPVLIGVLFWGTLLFYFNEDIFEWLKHLLPTNWQNLSDSKGFFVGIGNLFIKSLLYILLAFLMIILTLIGNVFVSIFYTPIVISYLHKKYYRDLQIDSFGNILSSMGYFSKSFGYFLLFAIILTPLYFVPFIGIFAVLIPHFFFFKNTMLFDVGSSIFEKSDYRLILSEHKAKNYQITAIAYLFSLIPIFNFLATLLQTIIIARYLLEIKQNAN